MSWKKVKLRVRKAFRIVVTVILFATIIPLVLLELFDRFSVSRQGLRLQFWGLDPTIHFTKHGIRYVGIGDPEKTPLILVHGAMISLLTWIRIVRFKSLYEHYYIIMPERPGYGISPADELVHSIEEQAQLLLDILGPLPKKAVVVGHSYGGPVAMMMGYQKPEKVQLIVGLAGQYLAEHEINYLVSAFFARKWISRLLPRIIRAANEEKVNHEQALNSISPLYTEIKPPIVLMHGDEDALVPLENSSSLKEMLGDQVPLIVLEGKDHPIPIECPEELVGLLLRQKH